MISRPNTFTLALCLAFLITGCSVLAPLARVRPILITSHSVPVGLYLIDTSNKTPEPGQMLAFTYDAPAWASDRYVPSGTTFVKYTLGAPGDTVLAHDGEIRVCQESTLLGQPYLACRNAGHTLAKDTAGRAMTAYPYGERYVLPAGRYYAGSTHAANSFDSRYYGPVQSNQILGVATPVLVWG